MSTEPPNPKPPSRLATALLGGIIGAGLALALIAGAVGTARLPLRHWLLADEQSRLDSIESILAEKPPAPVPLAAEANDRIAKLEAEIEELRKAIPPAGETFRLAERVENAERSMREMAQTQANSQALLLVAGQLRDAVDRGVPYDLELAALRRLLAPQDAQQLDPLTAAAATGIARREVLQQQFPALADRLMEQEEQARGSGWLHIALRHLRKVISLRRLDGKGNDAEAVVARAEAALKKQDWDQAVAEMRALPGNFAPTAADWIAQAEARSAADRALARITALAAARAAGH